LKNDKRPDILSLRLNLDQTMKRTTI